MELGPIRYELMWGFLEELRCPTRVVGFLSDFGP